MIVELFRHDHADLREPLIVGLQAGEHEIEPLVFHRAGQRRARHERVRARQPIVLDVDGAVGAARERFADYLRDARRPRRAHHHFAAVLLLQPQRLFERIRVRLVHLEAGVGFTNPRFVVVEARLPFARRDLFDANGDLHGESGGESGNWVIG